MTIRKASERDVPGILRLLSQVLELHAHIRPDLFVPGTTKYDARELRELLRCPTKPIFVAEDESGAVAGYVFCEYQAPQAGRATVPRAALYVDDLCVDETQRGKGLGRQLFARAAAEAARLGCYELTLNVWQGNETAARFYEAMGMQPQKTKLELILGSGEGGNGLGMDAGTDPRGNR